MNREKLLGLEGKVVAFDLDMTLTTDTVDNFMQLTPEEQRVAFMNVTPDYDMIDVLNKVAEKNLVYVFTARSDILQKVTHDWLEKHNVNCRYFVVGKPGYDCFIDDKTWNVNDVR